MWTYVFHCLSNTYGVPFASDFASIVLLVVRAHVPRMTLDELFEQKSDVAQAVLEELEKVNKFNIYVDNLVLLNSFISVNS